MATRFAASPGFLDAYSAISGLGVDPNKLTATGAESRSLKNKTAMQAGSDIVGAENQAEAMVKAAEAGAAATVAQGQAAGNASMMSGIMGGVSSLAGAIPGMGGGGGGFTSSLTGINYNTPIPYTVSNTPTMNAGLLNAF